MSEPISVIQAISRLRGIATKIYISREGREEMNESIKGLFTPYDAPPLDWPENKYGELFGIEFFEDWGGDI